MTKMISLSPHCSCITHRAVCFQIQSRSYIAYLLLFRSPHFTSLLTLTIKTPVQKKTLHIFIENW